MDKKRPSHISLSLWSRILYCSESQVELSTRFKLLCSFPTLSPLFLLSVFLLAKHIDLHVCKLNKYKCLCLHRPGPFLIPGHELFWLDYMSCPNELITFLILLIHIYFLCNSQNDVSKYKQTHVDPSMQNSSKSVLFLDKNVIFFAWNICCIWLVVFIYMKSKSVNYITA